MEYHEMVKEAAEARIGADRMAMGLPCIPDPTRGDMTEIARLREDYNRVWNEAQQAGVEVTRLRAALIGMVAWVDKDWPAGPSQNYDLRAALDRAREALGK